MNYASKDALALAICSKAMNRIKAAAWFPLKTGKLRDRAVYVSPRQGHFGASVCDIVFDDSIAPYIGFLEEGTKPHDIPGAFGYPLPFGVGGRFGGKFHPGSAKHKGFISNKSFHLAYQTALKECERIGKVEK